jgi:hypothetical protein
MLWSVRRGQAARRPDSIVRFPRSRRRELPSGCLCASSGRPQVARCCRRPGGARVAPQRHLASQHRVRCRSVGGGSRGRPDPGMSVPRARPPAVRRICADPRPRRRRVRENFRAFRLGRVAAIFHGAGSAMGLAEPADRQGDEPALAGPSAARRSDVAALSCRRAISGAHRRHAWSDASPVGTPAFRSARRHGESLEVAAGALGRWLVVINNGLFGEIELALALATERADRLTRISIAGRIHFRGRVSLAGITCELHREAARAAAGVRRANRRRVRRVRMATRPLSASDTGRLGCGRARFMQSDILDPPAR